MPVTLKNLGGVPIPSQLEQVRACEDGAEAFRRGLKREDCPKKYLPKMGDCVLYEKWVMGFRSAKIAGVLQKEQVVA